MNLQDLNAPPNLLEHFRSVGDAIKEDGDGSRTLELVRHFRAAEIKSQELRLRTDDYAQKETAGLLQEAFAAASRIALAAWKKEHGSELYA